MTVISVSVSRPETPRLNVYLMAFGLVAFAGYPALFWVARLDPATAMVGAVPLGLAAVSGVWASDRLFEVAERWLPTRGAPESLSEAVLPGVLTGLVTPVPFVSNPARPSPERLVFFVVSSTLVWIAYFGLHSAYFDTHQRSSQADERP